MLFITNADSKMYVKGQRSNNNQDTPVEKKGESGETCLIRHRDLV